jgi:hypothetical protein
MPLKNSKIIFLIIVIIFTGCLSLQYPNERKYEKTYIGMSENEFISKHQASRRVFSNSNTSIFAITYYKTDVVVTNSISDALYQKFYYFLGDKLNYIDYGKKAELDYGVNTRMYFVH